MKNYILLLFFCWYYSAHTQTIICASCDKNRGNNPETDIADVYIIQSGDEQGMSYSGIPILGQCHRITANRAFEYALTDQEITEFINRYGASYLNVFGLNYFLNSSQGNFYLTQIIQGGTTWIRRPLSETVPDCSFITVFMKKKKIPEL